VVLPVDTVYGLCGDPHSGTAAREIYRLKQRPAEQPLALLAKDIDTLLVLVPELPRPALALLPGPYTLVLPNPAQRFRRLTGSAPETIGVRVPELAGPGADVLGEVGAVVATSANLHGGAEARTLEDVPAGIRAGAAALVDGGELPGTPSTVLDLTGPEPRVLREGAVPAAEALERFRQVT
jgi:L-threonylcarbamoyladenylate synthase